MVTMQSCVIATPRREGYTRKHKKEKTQFLHVSLSSLAELETQVVISQILGYITDKVESEACEMIDHERRMLFSFIDTIEKGD